MTRWLLVLGWAVACSGNAGVTPTDSADTAIECALDRCGATCTDIDEDPNNCGDCGITCVVPHAAATCELGSCGLGLCEYGWADCDGDALNGCESESLCVDGASCATTCGTSGTQDCTDACAPVCVPPQETCNLADDDCDGSCDEDVAGCRVPVYRSHGSVGHLYGLDVSEAEAIGQQIESARYFSVMTEAAAGTALLYRCNQGGGRRFLTTSSRCEALETPPELTLGSIATSPTCGAIPLYRLYNPVAQNHFYTTSAPERDRAEGLGYRVESTIGYVWAAR